MKHATSHGPENEDHDEDTHMKNNDCEQIQQY